MMEKAAAFTEERDAVLKTLDPVKFIQFSVNWSIPLPNTYYTRTWQEAREVLLATMHKTRLQIRAFNSTEKEASASWLVEHGYELPEPITYENGILAGAEYDN